MRSRGDYAQVTEFKQSVVDELRAHGFDLRLAFEDDPSNHAMYVAAGRALRLHPLGLLRVAQLAGPTRRGEPSGEHENRQVSPVVVGSEATA